MQRSKDRSSQRSVQRAAHEVDEFYTKNRPSAENPVERALFDAYCRYVTQLLGSLPAISASEDSFHKRAISGEQLIELHQQAAAAQSTAEAAKELQDWLWPEPKRTPKDMRSRADGAAASARSHGWSDELIRELIEPQARRPRGRPITRRAVAIRSYEMRLLRRHLDWGNIAQKCCPCAAQVHGTKCEEAIRHEVIVLKKVLRKHGISLDEYLPAKGSKSARVKG